MSTRSAPAVSVRPEPKPFTAPEPRVERPRFPILFFLCVLVLLGVHALLVNSFMPFKALFNGRPLQGFDYDLHIGQVFRVVEALSRWGRSWLYDVQLLAGQPEGTITDAGSKGWELWTFALCSLGVPRALAFNSFVVSVMLTAPLWLFLAALNFRVGYWGSLLASAMTSTLWFFDSHLHWVWFVGMISWAGASCLALYTVSSFYRLLAQATWARFLLTALSLSVTLLVHPYTFFVMAPAIAVMYLRGWTSLSRVAHASVLAAAGAAILANAYWLINAARHWHYILNSAFYAQAHAVYLACDFFDVLCNGADSGVIGTRTGFRFLYLGLALAGLVTWQRVHDDRFLPIATSLIFSYTFSYLGAFIPGMQQTQPYRQITPGMLLSCVPAASFLADLARGRWFASSAFTTRALACVLSFALAQQLLASQVLYFFPEYVPRPPVNPEGARSPLSGYGHTADADTPDHIRYEVPHDNSAFDTNIEACIEWLRVHANLRDRVLVQAAVLGERLAWRGHVEVLGGFFERNVLHVDANFFREHQNYTATGTELARYLSLYAVNWVVGDRPEFRRAPGLLVPVASPGGYQIYRARLPANRVLQGGGSVIADENRIHVTGSDPNHTLLLSYHWHEALRCTPNCIVERERLDIDRVGLIRISPPHPADMLIWNSYKFP